MTRRYYHSDLPSGGGLIQLIDSEAQHATRVMRVEVGDRITLFDGKGHEAEAEIVSMGRRECCCQSDPAFAVDRESSVRLHLGIALPKPDRAKELIERLTELGVARVTPILGDRTQRPPSSTLLEKLRRAVIQASKQCGRNRLLAISEVFTLGEFVSSLQSDLNAESIVSPDEIPSKWITHPRDDLRSPPRREFGKHLIALVGPEGGWSEAEVRLATQNGFEEITLGKRILRIETAAAMIAALATD